MQESFSFVAFAACGLLSLVSHAQTHTHGCPRGRSTAPPPSSFSLLANYTECCHVSLHFVQYLAIDTSAKKNSAAAR